MKLGITLIAALLVSAALAGVASASETVCATPGTCVTAGGNSYGSGTCESATSHSETNAVRVLSRDTPLGYTYVNAYSSCYAYSFWGFTGKGDTIGVYAYNQNVGSAAAYWSASEGTFGNYCSTSAFANTAATGYVSTGNLGCPAGGPPASEIPVLP